MVKQRIGLQTILVLWDPKTIELFDTINNTNQQDITIANSAMLVVVIGLVLLK